MSAPDPGGLLQAPWRRLSARMLLIHPVNQLLSFLPAFLGLFLLGRASDNGMPWQIQAALVVIPVLLGVLRFFTTTYRITPEQLQLRRGLLQRATLTAPIDRVRTVDVTAPPLHRLLGLAKVNIGTGAGSPVELDGLAAAPAARLRVDLLHRAQVGRTGSTAPTPLAASLSVDPGFGEVTQTAAPGDRHRELQAPGPELVLGRFRPSWVRYAPFTFSGWVAALAAWGFFSQFGNDLIDRVTKSDVGLSVEEHVARLAWWTIALEVLLVLGVLISLLSVTTYVLNYWGYRLTRHPGGTLQITRGLLTTRAVSIEEVRVRGASLSEPMLLRIVGAARLSALLTGSGIMEATNASGRAMLIPPAPAAEVHRVAAAVLQTSKPSVVALIEHGPAARRRRYIRAMLSGLLVLGFVGLPGWWWDWYGWIVVASAVPLLASPALAADRYRSLGHAVDDGYLICRSGMFPRQRDMLALTGVIGWNVEASFFQRRAGLVTLVATTAAGEGSVQLLDVPTATAYRLIGEITPRLARPFYPQAVGEATPPGLPQAPAGRPALGPPHASRAPRPR